MNNVQTEKRLQLLRIAICGFFLLGILMSLDVWTSSRLFPLCPVFEGMPVFSNGWDLNFLGTVICFLALGIFFNKRWVFGLFFAFLAILLLQDQMRWQPWVYLYTFLLIPFLWKKEDQLKLIPYMQVLIVGVYLWSGIYKFNTGFIESTFDHMLEVLFLIRDSETRANLHFLGYLIPIVEIGIAVGLIIPRFRKIAVYTAILSHIVILTYLVLVKQNTVVYPWNLAMIASVLLLFYKNPDPIPLFIRDVWRVRILHIIGRTLFLALPFLAFFKLWDNYLSFKLYSGNNGLFCVAVQREEAHKIPKSLHPYLRLSNRVDNYYLIYVNSWAMDELNVAFYSQTRVFKQVGKSFCESGFDSDKLRFIVFETDFNSGHYTETPCAEICNCHK